MIKIAILNDNRCENNIFENEHGLSFFIDAFGKRILFDSAQTDIFIKNAEKLKIDLNKLDAIVLSHGDYDHGNGLKYLNTKTDLICHPDFSKTRISRRTGNNNGLNQTKKELEEKFNLIESKEPYYINDNIIFIGQIDKLNDFEPGKNLPAVDENNEIYKFPDDSGLIIKSKKGLIILSGCGHSGICNTITQAKKITGEEKVFAVMGGFHLKEVDDCTNKTMEFLKNNNVSEIYLAHCVSDAVCNEFLEKLPSKTKIVKTGMIYEFEE